MSFYINRYNAVCHSACHEAREGFGEGCTEGWEMGCAVGPVLGVALYTLGLYSGVFYLPTPSICNAATAMSTSYLTGGLAGGLVLSAACSTTKCALGALEGANKGYLTEIPAPIHQRME